ncbi:MAG: hypothetical protein FWG72_06195 [Oscillospiraceae bacterium]|nr:hypothetical protein [Oscillospiraceae bacterium]
MTILLSRILETADKRKISDQAINRFLKAHRNHVDDWKTQKSKPTTDEVSALSTLFNVSIDYLLGKTDDPSPSGAGHPVGADGQPVSGLALALAERMMRLSPSSMEKALDYVAFLEHQETAPMP